jgi:Pyruvate/2-oxoacid:ferredoxin oxidoreductase gamma subunit
MAMVGAMLARRPVFDLACVEQALRDHLPTSKAHLLENNLQVLRRGFAVGDTILV